MFTTIVVGTDGSTTASEAVRQAARLAGMAGAKLHIVHAFPGPPAMAAVAMDSSAAAAAVGLVEMAEPRAKEVLEHAVASAAEAGVTAQTHYQPGDPADVLLSTAESVGADLVIVGNKGMAGVRRMLGSVPNKVSHHAPCSVLIINTVG